MQHHLRGMRHIVSRCLIAVAAVAGAVLIRLPFAPILGLYRIPLVTFPLAVLVAGYFGGLGAGLLATALGVWVAEFFFMEPAYTLRWSNPADAVGLGLFAVVGIFTSLICEALRRARSRAEQNAVALHESEDALRQAHHALEERVQERTLELARTNESLQEEITERKQAEEQVRHSREWLHVMLTSIGDAVIASDSAGRVTFLNPIAESLTEWETEQALGQPVTSVFRIINEKTRETAEDIVARVLKEQQVIGLANHTALVTRGGREIPIEDSAAPIKDDLGNLAGAVLVFHDVTQRRRAQDALRESEERYRSLFENMLNGFAYCQMLFDQEGPHDFIYLAVNNAFETLTGLKNVTGKRVSEVIPGLRESDPELFEIYGRVAQTGTPERFETYVEALGMWFAIAVYSPAKDYFVAVFDVITERKRAEEELHRVNAQLVEADRRKDEFLAMLAHELRNPLAPVRNAVEVLRLAGPQEPTLLRQRDIIDRQVSHMAHLLDDLLDVSRITRGRIGLRKQRLSLAEVLRQAVEMSTPLIESRRHTLQMTIPPASALLDGDPDRLVQAISSLLANAARFTEEGGRIWLEAEFEREEAVIRVRDNGIGIAPDLLPHIFELFVQDDRGLDRARGGLGIGLTLVKKIVQLHGGKVEGRSEGLGQGSEFTIRLPLFSDAEVKTAGETPMAQGKSLAAPCRILVVDDVVDTAESLADMLRLFGHEVRTAYGGRAALAEVHAFHPNVLLLDIGMPDMDGYQVARTLRQEPAIAKIFIVALTGYGTEEDRRRALEAGFDRHLTKPVEIDRLQEILYTGCKS